MFCKTCGAEINDKAAVCIKCGVAVAGANHFGEKSDKTRVAYVLLALFLGCLGIHNFYAGYPTKAVIQLLISLLVGWMIFPLFVVGLWCLIEAITVTKDGKGKVFG